MRWSFRNSFLIQNDIIALEKHKLWEKWGALIALLARQHEEFQDGMDKSIVNIGIWIWIQTRIKVTSEKRKKTRSPYRRRNHVCTVSIQPTFPFVRTTAQWQSWHEDCQGYHAQPQDAPSERPAVHDRLREVMSQINTVNLPFGMILITYWLIYDDIRDVVWHWICHIIYISSGWWFAQFQPWNCLAGGGWSSQISRLSRDLMGETHRDMRLARVYLKYFSVGAMNEKTHSEEYAQHIRWCCISMGIIWIPMDIQMHASVSIRPSHLICIFMYFLLTYPIAHRITHSDGNWTAANCSRVRSMNPKKPPWGTCDLKNT